MGDGNMYIGFLCWMWILKFWVLYSCWCIYRCNRFWGDVDCGVREIIDFCFCFFWDCIVRMNVSDDLDLICCGGCCVVFYLNSEVKCCCLSWWVFGFDEGIELVDVDGVYFG